MHAEMYQIQQVQDGFGKIYWRGGRGGKGIFKACTARTGYELRSINICSESQHDFDTKEECIEVIEGLIKEDIAEKKAQVRRVVYTEDRSVGSEAEVREVPAE